MKESREVHVNVGLMIIIEYNLYVPIMCLNYIHSNDNIVYFPRMANNITDYSYSLAVLAYTKNIITVNTKFGVLALSKLAHYIRCDVHIFLWCA